jgi:hypothetical protein
MIAAGATAPGEPPALAASRPTSSNAWFGAAKTTRLRAAMPTAKPEDGKEWASSLGFVAVTDWRRNYSDSAGLHRHFVIFRWVTGKLSTHFTPDIAALISATLAMTAML